MVEQVRVLRPGSGGRWPWQKPEHRDVPTHYRPFTRAYTAGCSAKDCLHAVAPLLHLPGATAWTLIDTALWEAAGSTLAYLRTRKEEWAVQTAVQSLPVGHRLRDAGERNSQGMRRHAEFLDAETTAACRVIEDVCARITDVGAVLRAEDGARAAMVHSDRRGAYSALQMGRTVDLSDRVDGLAEGLRQMALV